MSEKFNMAMYIVSSRYFTRCVKMDHVMKHNHYILNHAYTYVYSLDWFSVDVLLSHVSVV